MSNLFGIDFGTTTTAISRLRLGGTFEPELIEIDNQRTIESVLRLADGNEIELIGLKAWEEISDAPERTYYGFKLDIASSETIPLPAGPASAWEIGVLFLRCLREKIEWGFLGNTSLRQLDEDEGVCTVIGYPSGWNEIQRKKTILMATEAGFPNVSGCEEPIGALYYHYCRGDLFLNKPQKVLIYDFGGGTSDVAIIETSTDDRPKSVSTSGIPDLGGRNFDERIAAFWEEKVRKETKKPKLTSKDRLYIKRHSRRIKENMTAAVEDRKKDVAETAPMLQCKGGPDTLTMTVQTFEEINKDLISRFSEPVLDALSLASLKPEDIDIAVLTGGSGRFYFARDGLAKLLPTSKILKSVNPQETVAKGLALYAKVLKCGETSIRTETEEKKNTNSTKNGRQEPVSTYVASDPYRQLVERKKHRVMKRVAIIAAVGFLSLWGWHTTFGQKHVPVPVDQPKVSPLTVLPPSLPDVSITPEPNTTRISEESAVTLEKLEVLFGKINDANSSRNISLLTALRSEVDRVDVLDVLPSVADVKFALSAWVTSTLDYYTTYRKHPLDLNFKCIKLSKRESTINNMGNTMKTEYLNGTNFIKGQRLYSFQRAKALLALGKKNESDMKRYTVTIHEFEINRDELYDKTNYRSWWQVPLFWHRNPNVKVIAGYELINGEVFPIAAFPDNDKVFEGVLKAKINNNFEWITQESENLIVFMVDYGANKSELLDWASLHVDSNENWHQLGSGCGESGRRSSTCR